MKRLISPSKQPMWLAPMLATLTTNYFSDPNWIYERKLDGMRCILYKKDDKVVIWSRNKIKQNLVFPELVTALEKINLNFILDAELVVLSRQQTSFAKLQRRMHVKNPDPKLIKEVPASAYIFDVLYIEKYNVCQLPLIVRKQILIDNFKFVKPLRLLDYKIGNGIKYFKYASQRKWEGLVAKQADSGYVHHKSKAWLKFKCGSSVRFGEGK